VKFFFFISISPGKRPINGIFSANKRINPIKIIIPPIIIKIFPRDENPIYAKNLYIRKLVSCIMNLENQDAGCKIQDT
jgi:hypothetical protein